MDDAGSSTRAVFIVFVRQGTAGAERKEISRTGGGRTLWKTVPDKDGERVYRVRHAHTRRPNGVPSIFIFDSSFSCASRVFSPIFHGIHRREEKKITPIITPYRSSLSRFAVAIFVCDANFAASWSREKCRWQPLTGLLK